MKTTFKKVSLIVLSVVFAITLFCGIFFGYNKSIGANALSSQNEAEAVAGQVK